MTPTDKILLLGLLCIQICRGFDWHKIRCSMDREPVEEGLLPPEQMGRFPWIGVIQHDFFSADTMRYSITGAVLIHPAFALAAAFEMVKIDREILRNSTHFIVWYSAMVKYAIGVEDYHLHEEYEGLTFATTALVQLARDGAIELGNPGPVMQICMPLHGGGSFRNVYAVKVTDQYGDFQKEVSHMDIVDLKNCDLYDPKAEPDHKMMVPTYPVCASATGAEPVCFIDSGAVLVSRDSEVYWTLLGFGIAGPSCVAPARFIYMRAQMDWISAVLLEKGQAAT